MRQPHLLWISLCLLLGAACQGGGNPVPPKTREGLDSVLRKQILYSNDAQFSEEPIRARGQAFLIQHEGATWAVTGLPFDGLDTLTWPTISYRELKKTFKSWRVFPRTPIGAPMDTLPLALDSTLDFPKGQDLLLLKPTGNTDGHAALTPQFELPFKDDTLYMITCSRQETECTQKTYRLVFQRWNEKGHELSFLLLDKYDLEGIGGSPILTHEGKVVGFVTGGGKALNLEIIYATHIAAIQTIRGG